MGGVAGPPPTSGLKSVIFKRIRLVRPVIVEEFEVTVGHEDLDLLTEFFNGGSVVFNGRLMVFLHRLNQLRQFQVLLHGFLRFFGLHLKLRFQFMQSLGVTITQPF